MRKKGLFIIVVLAMAFMFGGTGYAADWVKISGKVFYGETPLCAMILANGQYIFTDMADGKYELEVPLDQNGKITLFSFCDGLSPFKQVLTPSEAKEFDINMVSAPSGIGKMTLTATVTPIDSERVKITGKAAYNQIPLCIMVLANGNYMFTNQTDGLYELQVPLDDNGKITLFGFCDGLAPYKQILVTEEDDNDADNDGYGVNQGDCNDNNVGIYPGAAEICGDGIDQDCNSSDLICNAPNTEDTVYDYAQDNEDGMNQGNLTLFMGRISENCLNDGQDYSCLYQLWKWYFAHYDYMNTIYTVNKVSYENKDGKQLAIINRNISYTQTATENKSTGDITLILEDGKWKFYGNQKGYSAPSVSNMITCESMDDMTGELIGVKSLFTQSDESVTVFISVNNAKNGSSFNVKCYKPDGSLFSENSYNINWGDYPNCARFSTYWHQSYSFPNYEDIPGFEDVSWDDNIGIWKIEVSEFGMNTLKQVTFEVK